MATLAALRQPCVVLLLAACTLHPQIAMAHRFQVMGDMEDSTTVAVWTINLGSYDEKLPYKCVRLFGDVEGRSAKLKITCFYITDSEAQAARVAPLGWKPHLVKVSKDAKMLHMQRKLKIFGHILQLDNFDFSIYHDANMWPLKGTTSMAERIATALEPLEADPSLEVVTFHHPHRSSVHEERDEIRRLGLCTPKQLEANEHLYAGYDDNQGLLESSVFIRRGRASKSLQDGMRNWYETMETQGCFRDQLVFSYVMWKNHLGYKLLPLEARPWRRVRGDHADPVHVRFSAIQEDTAGTEGGE